MRIGNGAQKTESVQKTEAAQKGQVAFLPKSDYTNHETKSKTKGHIRKSS